MNQRNSDAGLDAVDEALGALAADVAPERDLWPSIEARIAPATLRRPLWHTVGLAAAVCLAVVAGLAVWTRPAPPQAPPVASNTPPASAVEPARPIDIGSRRVELASFPGDAYAQTRADALAELNSRIADLPPGQREIVERNLETIDRALAEIDMALAANPDDSMLKELLLNTYQRELKIIATVNRLAAPQRRDL